MNRRREVKVIQGSETIYEGPERRVADVYAAKPYPEEKRWFGLKYGDLVKTGIYLVGAVVFLIKADARIIENEKTNKAAQENLKIVNQFIINSDTWHSATTGILFQQGKPADGYMPQTKQNYNKFREADKSGG